MGDLAQAAAQPGARDRIAALRTDYENARKAAIDAFRLRPAPERLLAALSRAADRTLRQLWAEAGLPAGSALVAVGGYGRGELYPHSDVDLLILLDEAPDEPGAAALSGFVGACWDLGLEIGHSVRTVDECLAESEADVTVRTALLERRPLAGDQATWQRLDARLDEAMDPGAFLQAKQLEMVQRHVKYEDTPYSLEPNTKESPGGLRDLQVIVWIARAAGIGRNETELADNGLMTYAEARLYRVNQRMLMRIRAMLHIEAGRREDRLVFDLQAQVARALGFDDRSKRLASERMMQRYYWAAKSVTQLNTILMQNLEDRIFYRLHGEALPLDAEFRDRNGLLEVIDPDLFKRKPAAILRAFRRLQEIPSLTGMTTPTLRAMWLARHGINAEFRRKPANRRLFLSLLTAERGVTHELRRMNKWSILGRYLPAWRRIVGRMQHDLFHVYTVDQHILMVVRNLRRFQMPEHAHEYPLCSELASSLEKPWLLVIAALFHDIAKGRGGDHSELGKVDAARFCRDHGLGRRDTDTIVFLVEQHLTMSMFAQKQDLTDPEVITRFAGLVGTEERLILLYLLTVADVRGTSPKVWNAWKAKLLEDLFRLARRTLAGERPATSERLDARRREAIRLLNLGAVAPADYAPLWEKLDIGYFLRTEAQDIAWHTRVLHPHVTTSVPVVRCRAALSGDGFQVVAYLRDRPELFARICSYFDRKNLSILDARIHTTTHGYALDNFVVVDPSGMNAYRDILPLVETELTETLSRHDRLPPPVQGRQSRRSRHFPINPSVELRPDERGRHWLLSITANDRTGLLYRIALVLERHGVNLYTARVTTLGERAEDLFVIDGPALGNPKHELQIEEQLLETLRNG
ncbi:MAG: [protein-PII] uridylyltransferase [Burkholderiaceae bacterium]|nr:[protein-PII] uridylyltransferase [Burkholderiaceae bacterium]